MRTNRKTSKGMLWLAAFTLVTLAGAGLNFGGSVSADGGRGFIRPDAFIRDAKRVDGTPVFPALGNNFRCLQQSGDWCD